MTFIGKDRLLRTTVMSGALAALVVVPAMAADVTKARLENADAEPNNWLMPLQNYSSHHFSRLAQVNRSNVQNLRVAFTVPIGSALQGRNNTNMENPVLADDGMLYFDDASGVLYKVDARTGTRGTIVWKADAKVAKDQRGISRGLVLWGNMVLANLDDTRAVAVNRDTGEFVWEKQVGRRQSPRGDLNPEREEFTTAPIAAEGKLLVAQSRADNATNGWLAALDIKDGRELWRVYTIPAPGEPGHETWKDDHNAWKTGGAGLWTTGSYDPAQKATIWGTGQPVPMYDPQFRPGDNLYSNSAIAWDIETGKMKWYFQYTPNESWDYDEQGVHMLIDAPVGNQSRKMVTHFGRNGFYYQLDRTNGQFINAEKYVDQVTWTAGIDPKTGKPVEYNPNVALQTYIPATRFMRNDPVAKQSCPTQSGGLRWQPPAYNPTTQVAFAAGADGCFQKKLTVGAVPIGPAGGIRTDQGGGNNGGAGNPNIQVDRHGILTAMDVRTNRQLAKYRFPQENWSGVLATAGRLVFVGQADGAVTAHDDETLAELWRFETGIAIKAPPVAYGFGGKQYVAIIAGGPPPAAADYPELATMETSAILYVFAL